jgi:hypothetical protein
MVLVAATLVIQNFGYHKVWQLKTFGLHTLWQLKIILVIVPCAN